MFDHGFVNTTDFASKKDGEWSYRTWCKLVGINSEEFPFKVKTGRMHKGREVIFNVVSWGFYQNASGEWVVFVAYFGSGEKHTVQYSWVTDGDGKAVGVPRKYGFIN